FHTIKPLLNCNNIVKKNNVWNRKSTATEAKSKNGTVQHSCRTYPDLVLFPIPYREPFQTHYITFILKVHRIIPYLIGNKFVYRFCSPSLLCPYTCTYPNLNLFSDSF